MRLRRLKEELGERLVIEWRAFPLRPAPDPSARFNARREEAWKRCHSMSEGDGIAFVPWRRTEYPSWSLPALEAAKCVARQGPDAFERLHVRLFEAFFTHGRNIADPHEVTAIVEESGADIASFTEDYRRGDARDEVLRDYQAAVEKHAVRAIPTVIVDARRLVGLVDFADYRKVAEAG